MNLPPPRLAAPRTVMVFSGHRVDAPDRPTPRFPLALVPAARDAIGACLDGLGAGPRDLGLTQGAAGGDLLFAEACVARSVPVRLLLPLPEDQFIERSIRSSPGEWEQRYAALRARLAAPPQILDAPGNGEVERGDDAAFERCNRALLDAAFDAGGARVRLICLWDGEPGDGPGGTDHMVSEVRKRGGEVTWIDTRELMSLARLRQDPSGP